MGYPAISSSQCAAMPCKSIEATVQGCGGFAPPGPRHQRSMAFLTFRSRSQERVKCMEIIIQVGFLILMMISLVVYLFLGFILQCFSGGNLSTRSISGRLRMISPAVDNDGLAVQQERMIPKVAWSHTQQLGTSSNRVCDPFDYIWHSTI